MEGPAALHAAHGRLQEAIRAADLETLEQLIDDRFVHVGPDGTPTDKQSLLEARMADGLRIRRLEVEALDLLAEGTTGLTRATVLLTGITGDALYTWRNVVTRTWIFRDSGWSVLGEHLSHVD